MAGGKRKLMHPFDGRVQWNRREFYFPLDCLKPNLRKRIACPTNLACKRLQKSDGNFECGVVRFVTHEAFGLYEAGFSPVLRVAVFLRIISAERESLALIL